MAILVHFEGMPLEINVSNLNYGHVKYTSLEEFQCLIIKMYPISKPIIHLF